MRNRHATKAISATHALATLTALLIIAEDVERLSIDSLARSYRVPRRRIEQMVEAEKQRRASR